MLTVIVILCVLIWLPIIFHQISHRGFLVLLIWLLIAPVATNVVNGRSNPFFTLPEAGQNHMARKAPWGDKYKTEPTTITPREMLQPTRTIFGAFLLVFIVNAIMRKKHLIPLDRTEIWMGLFSGILVASVLLWSTRVAFGLRTAGDGLILPFLAYYIARRLVTSEDRFEQLTRVLGYLSLTIIISCLIERLMHSQLLYRLSGPFETSDGLYIVLCLILFAVVLDEKPTLPRSVRQLVLYLTPAIILLTFARANWVGFLSGAWVFGFLGYRLINRSQKMGKTGLLLTLVPLIVIGALALAPEQMIEQAGDQHTANWRLARWEVAWRVGFQNPIFGIGLNNLRDSLGQAGLNYSTAHNSFLTLFAENGIIGLFAYLAIAASFIQMGFRLYRMGPQSRDRWRGIGVIAVVAAYLIPALFANTLYAVDIRNVYVYVFLGGVAGLYSGRPSTVVDLKEITSVTERSLTPSHV